MARFAESGSAARPGRTADPAASAPGDHRLMWVLSLRGGLEVRSSTQRAAGGRLLGQKLSNPLKHVPLTTPRVSVTTAKIEGSHADKTAGDCGSVRAARPQCAVP